MDQYPATVTPTTVIHCQAAACRRERGSDEPRFAVAGTDLCNWHHARFPRILLDIAGSWNLLEASLVRRGSSEYKERVQTSGIADVATLWNPTAATAIDEITHYTKFLSRMVLRFRPLPADEITEVDRHQVYYDDLGQQQVKHFTDRKVVTHSHSLTGQEPVAEQLSRLAHWHSRWLSGYPGEGAIFLERAIENRANLMLALEAPSIRRVGLRNMFCSDAIANDDALGEIVCGAPLVGILPADTDQPSTILCSRNPTHTKITREQWMQHAGTR